MTIRFLIPQDGYAAGYVVSTLSPAVEAAYVAAGAAEYAPPDHSVSLVPVLLPRQLNWDGVTYPISPMLAQYGRGHTVVNAGMTAAEFFARRSQALSNPLATYYIDPAGNDANDGLTSGTAVRSIWKAVSLANAGGVRAKIMVKAGDYPRSNSPAASGTAPTVDVAYVAYGGRVSTGTWDAFAAMTADATHTNTYSTTAITANVNRVCDRVGLNRYGEMTELLNVATPTLCNAIPNSWCLSGGALYVNRADRAQVTNVNTRVLRANVDTMLVTSQVNVYIGGADADSGFDFEGCNEQGVVSLLNSSPGSTRNVFVMENCSLKQAGGVINTAARCFSMESWNGVAALFNCHAAAAATDFFNIHNAYASPVPPHLLLVNCTGVDAGRGTAQSNNALTAHEDAVLIDLGGRYEDTRGGSVRCIGTSRTLLAGTNLVRDLGDIPLGGAIRPSAVMSANNAVIYCDRVTIDMPAASRAYVTEAGTAAIYTRDCYPVTQPVVGAGTFGSY